MKFKNLIIIGAVLLAILTLGAVNASDNVTSDNLTVIDETVEIEEAPLDDVVLTDESSIDSNASSDDVSVTDFRMYIYESMPMQHLYDGSLMDVWNIPVDGTLKVWIDGKLANSTDVNVTKDDFVYIPTAPLGFTEDTHYNVVAKYITTTDKEIELANFNFYVYNEDPIVAINELLFYAEQDAVLCNIDPFTEYVDGTATVYINGKKVYSKKFTASQKIKKVSIKTSDIGSGYSFKDYKVKIVFKTPDNTYTDQRTVSFVPSLYCPYIISVGEKQDMVLTAKKGSTGTLKVYSILDDEKFGPDEYGVIFVKKDKIAEANIVNGVAKISMDKFPQGTHRFIIEYSVGSSTRTEKVSITINENTPGYSASVTPSNAFEGKKFTLKFTSPNTKGSAFVYIDKVFYKSFNVKSGLNKVVISKLKPGKHDIRITFQNGKLYFSKTFNIKVKPIKLTLKKVKIKKSARKLTLSATLKLDGKLAKGKKLTFKFKGKKYKAKTNKKGVAKVTIKKSVLKKLKVGKKVTYRVSYSIKTAKKTVKVRR